MAKDRYTEERNKQEAAKRAEIRELQEEAKKMKMKSVSELLDKVSDDKKFNKEFEKRVDHTIEDPVVIEPEKFDGSLDLDIFSISNLSPSGLKDELQSN